MKTNKKVWKIVSVVLALAMVVGLLPGNFLNQTKTVDAATVTLFSTSFETDEENYSVITTASTSAAAAPSEGQWACAVAKTVSASTDYATDGTGSLKVYNTAANGATGKKTSIGTKVTGLDTSTVYTVTAKLTNVHATSAYSYGTKVNGYVSATKLGESSSTNIVGTTTALYDSTQTASASSPAVTETTYSYQFTPTAETEIVGLYFTYIWKSSYVYVDEFEITYTDDGGQTWINYITPYDIEGQTDDNGDAVLYSSTLDAELIESETSDTSVGSFESSSDWILESSDSSTAEAKLETNDYYTNHSGSLLFGWYDSSEGNRMYATTYIGALAAGNYSSNVKAIGQYSSLYLVADLDGYTQDGEFEVTDEGYTILGTISTSLSNTQKMSYQKNNIEFELTKEFTNVQVGLMGISKSAGGWGKADDFFLLGPDNSEIVIPAIIYDDQISNGDFDSGNLKGWSIDCPLGIDATNYYYGYAVESQTGRSGKDSTMLTFYNSATNGSELEWSMLLTQYIRMNEAGEYKIALDSMGQWDEGNVMVMVYDFDEETQEAGGEELLSSCVASTEGDWNNYIEYITDETFTVEAGDIITVMFYIAVQPTNDYSTDSSAGRFDNIQIVSADYTGTVYTYHGTDQFEDSAFDGWGFSSYWTFTSDDLNTNSGNGKAYVDEDDNYLYGYAFPGKVLNATTGYYDTDPYLSIYNNQTDGTYSFELSQTIDFTKAATYTFQADLQGYLGLEEDGATFSVVATNEEGETVYETSLVPYSNDEFTTVTSDDPFTVSEGDTLTFTITGVLGALYTDEEGYECQGHINIDNIMLTTYVAREITQDELDFAGVTYTNSKGESKLVNGGNLITGVDLSSIISIENSGVTFTNTDGETDDIFEILAEAGVNYVRVRVWNDPTASDGSIYGGGMNDAAVAVKIAERAARAGLSLYVDFHYSDFYADPSHQVCPKAWADLTDIDDKADALSEFTTETLESIAATGVNIGIVSIGNETNTSFAGETDSKKYVKLFQAGANAVRAFDSDILVALHFAPTDGGYVSWQAGKFTEVDYDIFAVSYYPTLTSHTSTGDPSTLISELNKVAVSYGKMTMIAEYKWHWTWTDQDQYSEGQDTASTDYTTLNSSSTCYTDGTFTYDSTYFDENGYTVSKAGQYNVISDIITKSAQSITNCVGSFYWEPAWVDVGTKSVTSDDTTYSTRATKWAAFGSGCSTKAGASYLSWGSYTAGGSVEDINALFSVTSSTSVAKPLTFSNSDGDTVSTMSAFGIKGEDKNTPIDVAQAQISSVSNSKYAFRLVSEVNRTDVETIGFRVFTYDSNGKVLGTGYADKQSSTLYTSISADGNKITPDTENGWEYFYAYTYRNIPTGSIYYFEVRANSDDVDYITYFQRASKVYAVLDGSVLVIDADQIGTLTEDDFTDWSDLQ